MKNFKNYSFYGLIMLLILLLFDSCKSQKEVVLIDEPEQIISALKAKEMYDSYTNDRVSIIKNFEEKDQKDFDPTRYGWYDYATIKQYLAYIEQEAKEAGVEISGLKFYLARYPNSEEFADHDKIEHPRKNTFFIVPTTKIDNEDMSFCISVDSMNRKKMKLLERIIPQLKGNVRNGFTYKSGEDDNTESDSTNTINSLILNESNLVPPPHKEDID